MVEQDSIIAEKIQYFPGHLESAFSLASGGMGIHLHSVADFVAGRDLAKWAHTSLAQSGSNYLTNPYVFGWRWKEGQDTMYLDYGPHATSPETQSNLRLFDVMNDEYDKMRSVQLRLVFGGEEAIAISDPEAPITSEEEFISLLVAASRQGLIKYDPKTSPKIEVADDEFSLVGNLIKNGVEISEDLWIRWEAVKFSDRFREATIRAAVHKLGVMLALTEQLTFDAKALGVPISSKYKPTISIETWEKNWQDLFKEPMPDISGLYRQAHAVFVESASKEDPLVTHLFAIKELPHVK
ncbi:MAG: hypothetical protein HYV90_03995 [Candidatus Woesebacteria bacterium]|nr:MAG: hypothetical protein HYV90_03995 [Candidatus Woesebacteria bacterium]